MDVVALQTFLEVMRQMSFSDAARVLGTGPTSVSRAMTALELEVGAPLFDRTGGLSPTEAGHIFHKRIKGLMSGINEAQQEALAAHYKVSGTLRVGAPAPYGSLLLAPLLPGLAKTYPDLKVKLFETDSIDFEDAGIELAFRTSKPSTVPVAAQRLGTLEYAVVASPGYLAAHPAPLEPSGLALHHFLRFPIPGKRGFWRFRKRLKRKPGVQGRVHDVYIRGRLVTADGLDLKRCALAGMGLALLPRWLVVEELEAGKLREVFTGWEVSPTIRFAMTGWLLHPNWTYVPRRVEVFKEALYHQWLKGIVLPTKKRTVRKRRSRRRW